MDSSSIRHKNLSILLAEDDPSSQLLIERYLLKMGHNVSLANDGKEALEFLESSLFDLCILDMQMPKIDGLGVLKAYKTAFSDNPLPFIILTANSDESDIKKYMDAGADLYLNKPVKSISLSNAINSLLNRNSELELEQENTSIDISYLKSFNDQQFLDDFIDKFIESSRKLIDDLNVSINDDYESFMKIIHSIKGLSGNINAAGLRQATITAETIDEIEYKNNAHAYVDMIINELSRVGKALEQHASKRYKL